MAMVKQLLDYCASQEEAIITFNASSTILNVHSNAGYLNKKKARSRAGRHFFLSNNTDSPPQQRRNPHQRNHYQNGHVISG
jgi:hypothetical protein